MKKILFQILILVPILSYASDIEQNMSYQIAGITYTEYGIHGNGEKCSVTYDEDNSFASTTCLSITNSKGIKILCTQKKKMCKTEQELLDFVSPSKIDNKSNNNIGVLEHWVNAHNTQDMNELKNLYSTEITYYGKKLLRTKCIKDKKRVFRKYPQFKIRTNNIQYISITPTITKITFDKYVKFSPDKKEKMYPSYLLVDLSSSSILVEGDTVTDTIKNEKTYITKKSDNTIKEQEQACNVGYAKECSNLGMIYGKGIGVKKNYLKALEFFNKACDGGDTDGCFYLGVFHTSGRGVKISYFNGAKFYKKACQEGHAMACSNLAVLYEGGLGVRQSYFNAKKFYGKACDGGNEMGCNAYSTLNRR